MKKIWNSFLVAFAMFSKIPMPGTDWNRANMKYALCFFPFVGLAMGAMEYLWFSFAVFMGFGVVFRAAVMTWIPIAATGGIHMDGFVDTVDALSSWREKEQRLAILKDPHAGAFAIIFGCAYFLLYFGAATEMTEALLPVYCLGFGISRCFSVLSLLYFHNVNPGGSAAAFSDKAQKKTVEFVTSAILIVLCVLMCAMRPLPGMVCIWTALVVFLFYRYKSSKYFGGITGDLAGYFVCLCELWMLAMTVMARFGMEKFL